MDDSDTNLPPNTKEKQESVYNFPAVPPKEAGNVFGHSSDETTAHDGGHVEKIIQDEGLGRSGDAPQMTPGRQKHTTDHLMLLGTVLMVLSMVFAAAYWAIVK
jgi:hypothetical protein